jgi:DNA-binding transcriptional ArsR family regulator
MNTEKITTLLVSLTLPRRLQILHNLCQSEQEYTTVSAVAHAIGCAVYQASRDLIALEAAGLVRGERRGRGQYYWVSDRSRSLMRCLESL